VEKEAIQLLASFFTLLERIDKRLERLEALEQDKIESKQPAKDRLIPLSDWNKYHVYPPVASLRHIVFFESTNGASKFIRRIGRRVLICEKSFFEWVEVSNKALKK